MNRVSVQNRFLVDLIRSTENCLNGGHFYEKVVAIGGSGGR